MKTFSYLWRNFLVFLFFIFTTTTFSQSTTVPFTTSTTWTCPAGVTSISVDAYGAGGGGGYGGGANKDGGGGGGGGAFNRNTSIAVNPGTTYTITIGLAGAAGTLTTPNGGLGGTTTATFGAVTISANGGNGGLSFANGMTGGNGGTGGLFSGGTGADGNGDYSGAGGGAAGPTSNGTAGTTTTGGTGGGGNAGNGANGSTANTATGSVGFNYGGGGSGGTKTSAGGAGAAGYMTITYTLPNPCTSATTLACGTTNQAGTTVGSSNFTHNTGCSMSNYGKWYTFVGDGQITTISSTASFDHEMSISSGSCGTLSSIICLDDSGSGGTESHTFTTVNGTTYFVYIAHYLSGSTTTGTFTISRSCTPAPTPPANDNCNTAIPLTINSSCTYGTYTTLGATASTTPSTPPAPGCASYSGGDVWFSFVVPANGIVTVDTQAGGITDSGMAWYTGTCGALTLLECDDDDSTNGSMSMITRTGLTPGSTIYVRVWEYSNDNPGTFGICVTSPVPCTTPTAQPTALVLNVSGGSINGSFTAASPAPTNYLVVYNTTGTTPSPTNGTSYTVGGTIGAGNIVADIDSNTNFTVSGLSSSTTYYFFVFAYNTGLCTGGPLYYTTTPLTGNATIGVVYCSPISTSSTDNITSFVTTLGQTNINYSGTFMNGSGYGDFYSTQTVTGAAGAAINFTEAYDYGGHGFNIWVDWNNDGDFVDGGEKVFASAATASSHTGSFNIPALAAAGNYRMRVRAWYSNNNPDPCTSITYGEALDFKLTVITPLPCSGNPSNLVASGITGSTATISWTAATPAPASGYQYYLSTINNAPLAGTTPTGSVGAGITSVNLTGLMAETTYYVWVRSNCGGGLGQGYWIGPVRFQTPCASNTGIGVSDLACPNVISGGLGLNGADPLPIDCISASNCVDLEANYLNLGETTTYKAEAIPYIPPYQFGCLANPVSVNIDDRWSPIITLPFDFCFYGVNYNQCLISSNGVISFDITNNTPEGFSDYSFSNNLPSTSLFLNSIFGVYHDIDPSKGGEVGWELITLNSGCRALVASWKDIPMFSSSCNSQLYTGMIVLYENTNVIEVYIEEKNVCASWNGGNAVVGIQNAAGSQAIVAPGRNSLDTDWTVTNEAWRFIPDGTSITSITWYEGSGTSGTVVGSTKEITVCPSTTTIYTAEVTYTLCDGSTLKELDETTVTVNGAKEWNGSVSTDWNVANNWTPTGVPTAMDCVVIPDTANDPIISGTNFNGLGLNLTIENNANLTVTSNNDLTITDWININAGGDLILQNSASLIQTNNAANQGTMHMDRTANIRKLDYVYWSSPVASFASSAISPGTSAGYIYKWTPTIPTNTNGWGNWAAGNENMVLGKGYIVRGPDSFTSTITPFTATFAGTPNNGIITTPISRGIYDSIDYTAATGTLATKNDDNWNLIGNPYPSAVRAIDFLTLNTNIDGFINIWTHGTLPSSAIADPFYNNYVYNYTPGDYITYNSSGVSAGPGVFNGNIAAGQGFFVLMNHTSAGTSENVTFNNSMRSSTYDNSQFFRNSNDNGRIWLDLIAPNGLNVRNLVAYADGATNERDRLFDAITDEKLSLNLYSAIGDEFMKIQGRTLPFDQEDQVPMGIKVSQNGNYTIGIGALDGFFTDGNQNIYLEDKENNIIHDLRQNPYSFSAVAGNFPNRFVLRYTNETLGNDDIIVDNDNLWVISSDVLSVKSTKNSIKSVRVYDVLGRDLAYYPNVDGYEIPLTKIQKNNAALIVQVTLSNGVIVNKKVLY
jgi:hypothetical protein